MDKLKKHCIIVVEWCWMCRESGESVDHLLLLHCEIARTLYNRYLGKVGLSLLIIWLPQIAAVLKVSPICLVWCIWWERNDRNFEDHEQMTDEPKTFFINSLFLWASVTDLNELSIHDLHSMKDHMDDKHSPKKTFFGWTASLGKIFTLENLSKCRVVVMD